MSYATTTTIFTLLPGLPATSVAASGHTETAAIIDEHIVRADNLINGKIAARYDVSGLDTTTSVPPMLKSIAEDISCYFTFRSIYGGDNANINDWIDKYDLALDWLNEIRNGEMELLDSSNDVIPERSTSHDNMVASTHDDYASAFNYDDVLNWKVDDDLIDSIEDDRD